MKKLLSTFVIAAFLLQSIISTVSAQERDIAEPPQVELVYGIYRNEPAPYTGVLLSIEAVASIIARHKATLESVQLEVDRVKRDAEASKQNEIANLRSITSREKAIIQARFDAVQEQNKLLVEQLALLENRKKPNWKVWSVVGVGAAVVLGVAATFIVMKVKD